MGERSWRRRLERIVPWIGARERELEEGSGQSGFTLGGEIGRKENDKGVCCLA